MTTGTTDGRAALNRRAWCGVQAWENLVMPRFYFGFRRGNALSRDHDGLELDSIETAYLQAFWAAQELWLECLLRRRDPGECAFEITDGHGNLLMVLPFSEVLESWPPETRRAG